FHFRMLHLNAAVICRRIFLTQKYWRLIQLLKLHAKFNNLAIRRWRQSRMLTVLSCTDSIFWRKTLKTITKTQRVLFWLDPIAFLMRRGMTKRASFGFRSQMRPEICTRSWVNLPREELT